MKRTMSILVTAAFAIGFFATAALALYLPDRNIRTHSAIPFQMPGKGFSYSNVGYNLLELMIEEVTGRGLAEYTKNEILYPKYCKI